MDLGLAISKMDLGVQAFTEVLRMQGRGATADEVKEAWDEIVTTLVARRAATIGGRV